MTYKALPDLPHPAQHLYLYELTSYCFSHSLLAALVSLLFLIYIRDCLCTLTSFAWSALPLDIHMASLPLSLCSVVSFSMKTTLIIV